MQIDKTGETFMELIKKLVQIDAKKDKLLIWQDLNLQVKIDAKR